jgi:hypothetical protein
LTSFNDKKLKTISQVFNKIIKNNKEVKIQIKLHSIDEYQIDNDLEEKIYTVSLLINDDDKIIEKIMCKPLIQPINCFKVNLNKNQKYNASVSYFDKNFSVQYFYIQLKEYCTRLEQLNTRMQSNEKFDFKVDYITSFSDLKINDNLEALFYNQKWYRVKVIKIKEDHIKCFFLDYGNTEIFEKSIINKNKIFRKRSYYEDESEAKIFNLKYQAIKCVYLKNNKPSTESLIISIDLKESFNIIVSEKLKGEYSIQLLDQASDQSYDALLIGTSMINNIDVNDFFPDLKCLFKSINGGKTTDILEYLKKNEDILKSTKYFIITCGSNDVDSLMKLSDIMLDHLQLVRYLENDFKDAQIIFNKLIPRIKCRHVTQSDFEKRRSCFNKYLEILPFVLKCQIVEHLDFEADAWKLAYLLADGVHISTKGLPIYTKNISNAINKIRYN